MVLTNVLHLHGRDLCPVNPHWMPVDEHMISHTLRKLGIESSEVFIVDADKCKVKVIDVVSPSGSDSSNHEDTVVKWASSREAMEALLEQGLPQGSSRVLVVDRLNSWSVMNVTSEVFCLIFNFYQMTPHFLKLVTGFRRKFSAIDEDFVACYSRISYAKEVVNCADEDADNIAKYASAELCYNVRHFECHGRQLEDPWSCRQSAIYHKYHFDTRQSAWVIIQPPHCSDIAQDTLNLKSQSHPLYFHISYLSALSGGWRKYLDHLAGKLKESDDEIAICKPYGQYGIDFSSKQKVHNLRRKMHYARLTLANNLNTLENIKAYESTIAKAIKLPSSFHDSFRRELSNLSNELRNHSQTIQRLLKFSNDIRRMYDDVLASRGQELIHVNGLTLAHIAQAQSAETRTMVTLADKTQQDSRSMRIATLIALIYLPANLVMSFFSTTLIWFENDNEVAQTSNSSLRIHREMWIAVISTIILALGTVLASSWWHRSDRKTNLEKV